MPKSRQDKKKEVEKALKASPDGLTIQGVSKKGKMSRITATIYLHELLGEKKVMERKVGAYRLFFWKDNYLKAVSNREIVKKIKDSI